MHQYWMPTAVKNQVEEEDEEDEEGKKKLTTIRLNFQTSCLESVQPAHVIGQEKGRRLPKGVVHHGMAFP